MMQESQNEWWCQIQQECDKLHVKCLWSLFWPKYSINFSYMSSLSFVPNCNPNLSHPILPKITLVGTKCLVQAFNTIIYHTFLQMVKQKHIFRLLVGFLDVFQLTVIVSWLVVKSIIFLNDGNNNFNEWLLSICKKISTYPHVQYHDCHCQLIIVKYDIMIHFQTRIFHSHGIYTKSQQFLCF